MPYSDLGVLLPTESQYGNPAAYTEAIRAESNKQATYLSNMDQFYAQLEESKRQFDLNYTARSKEFEWTSGFEEKKLTVETGLAERRLEMEQKQSDLQAKIMEKQLQFQETELGFKKEQLGLETQKLQAELERMRQEVGIAERGMELQEKLGFGKLDLEKSLGLGQLQLGQQELGLKAQTAKETSNLEYLKVMAGLTQAFPGGVTDYSSVKAPGDFPKNVPVTEAFKAYLPKVGQSNYSNNQYTSYYSKWGK